MNSVCIFLQSAQGSPISGVPANSWGGACLAPFLHKLPSLFFFSYWPLGDIHGCVMCTWMCLRMHVTRPLEGINAAARQHLWSQGCQNWAPVREGAFIWPRFPKSLQVGNFLSKCNLDLTFMPMTLSSRPWHKQRFHQGAIIWEEGPKGMSVFISQTLCKAVTYSTVYSLSLHMYK